jgi:hypothetical protein
VSAAAVLDGLPDPRPRRRLTPAARALALGPSGPAPSSKRELCRQGDVDHVRKVRVGPRTLDPSLTCDCAFQRSGRHANPQVTGAHVQLPLGQDPFVHGAMRPVLRLTVPRRADSRISASAMMVGFQEWRHPERPVLARCQCRWLELPRLPDPLIMPRLLGCRIGWRRVAPPQLWAAEPLAPFVAGI